MWGSAGAVRDAKLAQRINHRVRTMPVGGHGEDAKVTGLSALLFETRDADFKVKTLTNLPVLEVTELFVDVVDFGFEPVHPSFDCGEPRVDFRKFGVHISSQVSEFFMHACEMRFQSGINNVLDLVQIAFVHIRGVYHAGAGEE